MKIVSVYYAFDDTDFYTEEECLEYEAEWKNAFHEMRECYDFFDRDMNMLICASDEFDDLIDWIEKGYESAYVSVKAVPSEKTLRKMDYYFGFEFPTEVGLNKYDNYYDKWMRVE